MELQKYTSIDIGHGNILQCEGELSDDTVQSIQQFYQLLADNLLIHIPTSNSPLKSINGTDIYLEFMNFTCNPYTGDCTTVCVHRTTDESSIELRATYDTAIADIEFMMWVNIDYPHIESLHDNTHPYHYIDLPIYYRKWLAIRDEQSETDTIPYDDVDEMLCDAANIEMDGLFQSWYDSQEYYHSREIWQHQVRVYRTEWL